MCIKSHNSWTCLNKSHDFFFFFFFKSLLWLVNVKRIFFFFLIYHKVCICKIWFSKPSLNPVLLLLFFIIIYISYFMVWCMLSCDKIQLWCWSYNWDKLMINKYFCYIFNKRAWNIFFNWHKTIWIHRIQNQTFSFSIFLFEYIKI